MQNLLEQLDLNLLRMLKAIVETGNTHQAAERLNVSQTSVSRGMAKLREVFGDQLFVRKAHGVEPSELAIRLADAVDQMLSPVSQVLLEYHSFEPATYQGTLKIIANGYLLEIFGCELHDALRETFPEAHLRIEQWHPTSTELLNSGDIDYGIELEAVPLPQSLCGRALCDLEMAIIAREDHPVLSHSSEWADINHLQLIQLVIPGVNEYRNHLAELYARLGFRANIALRTQCQQIAAHAMQRSDAILFAAKQTSGLYPGLTTYELPPVNPDYRQLRVNGYLAQTRRNSPLHLKIHEVISQTLSLGE
ncbi:LysR family transcriptional regulator [Shewanella spartinae]|uniref:LysR family transcriptional regulator n=1 Tax=Shewanella spartinae TaxID=2864205 RepID=UPI0021AC007E|nr:LysR family transcriptional regulator [Shewanella spartinae]